MNGAPGSACHNLPAGNPDVHAKRTSQPERQLRHDITDGKRGTHGALGIVAVGNRRTEQGHDAVADVFVNAPAVVVNQAVDGLEETRHQLVDFLGAEFVDQGRVAGKIGEERGHLPPLAPCRRGFW